MRRNEKLKDYMRAQGVEKWRVAEAIGVSESTFYRWLRKDISKELYERAVSATDDIKKAVK